MTQYKCTKCSYATDTDSPPKSCPKCKSRSIMDLDTIGRINKNSQRTPKDYPKYKAKEPTKEQKEILKSPDLLDKLTTAAKDLIGGQDTALRTAILLCCVVFVEGKRLNILLSASPSHQKSHMAKVLRRLFPVELVVYYAGMSQKFLQYKYADDDEWTWNNKVLFIEDATQDFLDSEVVKVFMSDEGKAGTVQEGMAIDLEVNGRPTILITTAKSEITTEFSHRMVIIPFQEGEQQRLAAMENMVLDNDGIKKPYDDILSKLKPVKVNIPFKKRLPKHFPKNERSIRDFKYFLTTIECSAALNQYSRKQKGGVIDAGQEDYENAIEVLNSLGDEGILGLTNTQRKLYAQMLALQKDGTLKDSSGDGFNVHSLMTKIPGRARQNWYDILDALVEAHHVAVMFKPGEWEDKDGNMRKAGKDVQYYKAIERENAYKLPKWAELMG